MHHIATAMVVLSASLMNVPVHAQDTSNRGGGATSSSTELTKGVSSGGSGNDENAGGPSSLGTTGSTTPAQHGGATKSRVPGGQRNDRSDSSTVKSGK